MSLSPKNLSLIQKTGQAAHGAAEAIAATVRAQAESMVASVSSQPFGDESEQSIARFKVLARLSQGLVEVEAKLQELYAVASDLANPASDVIIVKAVKQRKSTNALAIDVVAKPAKVVKVAKAKKGGRKAAALTSNDTTLLQYLQSVLKAGEWTAQTGAVMAAGAGLPLGSVGVSLKKILASGAVKAGERGMYQLSSAIVTPEMQGVPARKTKPTSSKKVKAVTVVASNAQEVKSKPAKKAKTTPAKKVKVATLKPAAAPAADAPAEADAALV